MALDPGVEGGGNCAPLTYLGLLALEERLGDTPGFFPQFEYNPHVLKANGSVVDGHARGRLDIGGGTLIFDYTRDGKITIGPPSDFEMFKSSAYYPIQEGYEAYMRELCALRKTYLPCFDRDEVLSIYKNLLRSQQQSGVLPA